MRTNNCNGTADTSLTKVFVGGLAWETPKEALREHFEKYGEIIEAVVILDKVTGKSKGYGFVTFKDPEAAKNACEDATPFINGRRANCNIAALGARRPTKATSPLLPLPPPAKQGYNIGTRPVSAAPASYVQWHYPPVQRRHFQAVPVYGYSPAYIAPHLNYNPKFGYTSGAYMNGYYPQVYSTQPTMGTNTMMPMYPFYQQTAGLPANVYPTGNVGSFAAIPAHISKPASMGMVGAGENLKKIA